MAELEIPACVTCGQPVAHLTECMRCGKPVHMDNNEACGAWLLESWHDAAATDNAFWCKACLKEQAQSEQEQPEQKPAKRCDRCRQEVDKLYDVTPAAMPDTTIYVCDDCYELTAHELEADGYSLDLGM